MRARTPRRLTAGLVGGVLAGAIGAAGCGSGGDAPAAAGAPPAGRSAAIGMRGVSFTPDAVSIRAAGTVTWRNTSTISHNVTAAGFTSKTLDPGARYARTFPAAGTFAFRCTFHAGMTGTVVVTGP